MTPLATDVQTLSLTHRLGGILWQLLVASVVLLAIYVSASRLLMANVPVLQDDLLQSINEQLPFTLEAGRVEGRIDAFTPELVFTDLRLSFPDPDIEPLYLARGSVRLAPLRSLLTWSPQASVVRLSGLSLQLTRDSAGAFRLLGFGSAGTAAGLQDWLTGFLTRVEELTLEDNRILLRREQGPDRSGSLDLSLRRSGSQRVLDAHFESSIGNRANIHAEGIGNPLALDSWRGDIFVDLEAPILRRLFDWFPGEPSLVVAGSGRIQAWLQRASGRSGLGLRIAGSQLNLSSTSGGWSVPLQSLSTDAALQQQRDGGWTLHASDLDLMQADLRWRLPRARFDLTGDSLFLGAADLRLDGIDTFLASVPGIPQGLADALIELSPKGHVPALELSIDDLRAPAKGWDLTARVEQVAVNSWRGAPGAAGATAYVHLYPGAGEVRLDSQEIELVLPSVYRQPLAYQSVHGDVALDWTASGMTIRSGLLTAEGDEGASRALLGLDIPFSVTEVGPAMSLLVGLRDSQARYRTKYLPYTLPENLRDWLARSIGTGRVATGGFAWRGSLRPRNYEHLTVQLFFDLEGTQLAYDPRWPPLEDFFGQVLIDDRRISVWSDRAMLLGSRIESLSAETWPREGGTTVLAVNASASGDAGDGLSLLNVSPLGERINGALTGWSGKGGLDVELSLTLPLQTKAVPDVSLRARLQEVELGISPGGLQLQQTGGAITYTSDGGFASEALRGRLWGSPIAAQLEQSAPGAAVHFVLEGELNADGLGAWLGQDDGFVASGKTRARGELVLSPGSSPRLDLRSDLAGVVLDLPAPWAKTAAQSRQLAIDLTLGRGQLELGLALDESLEGEILLVDGAVRGGRLRLESDWLQGALDVRDEVPRLLIDWLNLDALPEFNGGGRFNELHDWLRPAEVDVLTLYRGGVDIGNLSMDLDSDDEAIYANGIRGEILGLRLQSEEGGLLRWSGGDEPESHLTLDLGFDNLGQVFSDLGYAPTLISESGTAALDLRWSGSPMQMTVAGLKGSLVLSARDGRLLDAGSTGGALKVLSLLNLAEILRGLSLAHMFESGIPFERARSEFLLRSGVVEIPSVTLKGAASAFEFSGFTDLTTINGELAVTLPVANNLPWVAALAAGLPVAAGVYVVSKVFEKQVKRMSSAVYQVSGPIGSPSVKLRRIFDDSATAPVDLAVDQARDPVVQPDTAESTPDPAPSDNP